MSESESIAGEVSSSSEIDLEETKQIDELLNQLDQYKEEFESLIQRIDETMDPDLITKFKVSIHDDEMMHLIRETLGSIGDLYTRKSPEYHYPSSHRLHKRSRIPADTDVIWRLQNDPCSKLPNYGVVLIKSPISIEQLWDEYTKVPQEWSSSELIMFLLTLQKQLEKNESTQNLQLMLQRQTSIQTLETYLGSTWRNIDKNFSRQINRRKKIWNAIEDGLQDGLPLDHCFKILELYARQCKKGLSEYYNGVPFKLVEKRFLL